MAGRKKTSGRKKNAKRAIVAEVLTDNGNLLKRRRKSAKRK